jgi:hypothetical protein
MTWLLPQHEADLKRSGIDSALAFRYGIRSETDPRRVAEHLHWARASQAVVPCMLLPYLGPDEQPVNHVRIKPDKPFKLTKDGKPAKYLGPKGKRNRVYFPLGIGPVLQNPSIDILVTEGEKKAICAQLYGLPCLGLAGVECWSEPRETGADGKKVGPRELHADLKNVVWSGRRVYIVFDSDRITKPGVRRAEAALAEALRKLGATVLVVQLPDGPVGPDGVPAKQGLDDFLVANGADALRELLAKAVPPETPAPAAGDTGGFQNYFYVEEEPEDGEGEPVLRRFGKSAPELVTELIAATCGWPKRMGKLLFAIRQYQPVFLESPAALMAWISAVVPCRRAAPLANPVQWKEGADLVTQTQFFAALQQSAEAYDAIASYPHEPQLPGFFYAHPPLMGGNGAALFGLLRRLNPATSADADLILALFLTMVCGVPHGQRPAWLITAEDGDDQAGRGVGKTSLVRLAARLVGGEVSYSAQETLPDFTKRLLSPDGRDKRVVLIDNVKSHRFSSADLESLITAGVVSGRQLYVGEGRHPNCLTFCITVNGATMSKDLAQRVVTIKLRRPKYAGNWESETTAYLEEHRWAILGDLVARLRRGNPNCKKYTRWGEWEKDVLTCVHDPKACQALILERQGEIDDDQDDLHLVRDAVVETLKQAGVDPDQERILIPSKQLANLVNEALQETRPVNKVSAFVKTLGIVELRKCNRSDSRGWIWSGCHADRQAVARRIFG